jgi:hypothetical protein
MKVLTCAAARRRLHAFHDQELALSDQVAVSAHLDWCDECASAFAELRALRAALRSATAGRLTLSGEEDESFQRAVVSRARAEQQVSWSVSMRAILDDRKVMYAVCGAAVAAFVCVVITLAMLRFANGAEAEAATASHQATLPRSDIYLEPEDLYYLAAIGSNQNPVSVGEQVRMPRPLDGDFSPSAMFGSDAVFMVAATVTREGRVANPELLETNDAARRRPGSKAAKAAEDFLGAVSRVRFEPASMAGLPVAVNMVWLVAHTTVRAKGSLDLPSPTPKRRRAVFDLAPPPPRTIRV